MFISRHQHDWLLSNYPKFMAEKEVLKLFKKGKWCLAGVTVKKTFEVIDIMYLLRGYVKPEPKQDFKFVL